MPPRLLSRNAALGSRFAAPHTQYEPALLSRQALFFAPSAFWGPEPRKCYTHPPCAGTYKRAPDTKQMTANLLHPEVATI